jgi:hypothetical protein
VATAATGGTDDRKTVINKAENAGRIRTGETGASANRRLIGGILNDAL